MSDIKIFYSSKRIKKIINDCDFLDIFSTDYCCNYLRDGNNLTSLAIHYLERKQSCILFIFIVRAVSDHRRRGQARHRSGTVGPPRLHAVDS